MRSARPSGSLAGGEPGSEVLTLNTVELIPTLGALSPPRRARPGPGPHTGLTRMARPLTRWNTRVSLGLDSGVLQYQICTREGPKGNCARQVDF